jgi:hypothetical protein
MAGGKEERSVGGGNAGVRAEPLSSLPVHISRSVAESPNCIIGGSGPLRKKELPGCNEFCFGSVFSVYEDDQSAH